MALPLIPIAIALAQEFLPSLVGRIAGDKSGAIADQVIKTAEQITGVSVANDPRGPAVMLRADPTQLLEFQRSLAEIEHQTTLAYLNDRQDARTRDVDLRRLGDKNRRADYMIIGDVTGLVLCLGALITLWWLGIAHGDIKVPEIVWVTLGSLITHFANGLRDAHQFEFGSSRGSKEKDAAFQRLSGGS